MARSGGASGLIARGLGIEVRDAGPRGRGVFAAQRFTDGEVIERCPVIVVERKKLKVPRGFFDYHFRWQNGFAVALGYGSLYNHSYRPNAWADLDYEGRLIVFRAWGAIRRGAEILINYAGGDGEDAMWFDVC